MAKSPIHYGDSYKYGHSGQYIPMVAMHDYLSSRGGKYPATLFTGAQGLVAAYLTKRIKKKHVIKLAKRAELHGIPFDYEGWMYIVEECDGYLPIKISAMPEGTLVPTGIVLMTIESTDENVPWVVGFVETLLMKVWYSTTISTKSYYVMQTLLKYGPKEWAQFAFHAFGDRACSTPESAAVAGFAHLAAGFKGTDNFESLDYCETFYGVTEDKVAGYSVFATEHSSTTSHGRDGEEQFVWDQLQANPDAPIMSFVADSYDVYAFTHFCTDPKGRIRKLIESRPHQKLVLRPDSGEPIDVLRKMTHIMYHENAVDHIITEDNKALFTDFGILWGDGITPETIEKILNDVTYRGYSPMNFVFGSGGDLMQNVTRDTQRFAIKCSNVTIELEDVNFGLHTKDIPVYKDPITDPGKASLRGKVTTYRCKESGKFFTTDNQCTPTTWEPALHIIFENGKLYNQCTLEEIQERVLNA